MLTPPPPPPAPTSPCVRPCAACCPVCLPAPPAPPPSGQGWVSAAPLSPLLSAASKSRQQRLPSEVKCMLQHTTPWHTHTRAHPGAPIPRWPPRPGHPHFLPAGQLGWCCTPSTFKVAGGGACAPLWCGHVLPPGLTGGQRGRHPCPWVSHRHPAGGRRGTGDHARRGKWE